MTLSGCRFHDLNADISRREGLFDRLAVCRLLPGTRTEDISLSQHLAATTAVSRRTCHPLTTHRHRDIPPICLRGSTDDAGDDSMDNQSSSQVAVRIG